MQKTSSWIRFLLVAAVLAGTALFLHARRSREVVPPSQPLASFPHDVAAWRSQDLPIPQDVREVLGPGDFLSRLYVRAPQEPYIDFFVAYFASQRTGNTIHSPKNCLPGSGWTPLESERLSLPVPGQPPLLVNRYIIAKGLDRQLVLYWYQAHGRAVASEYWAKIYLVTDAMRTNRTDGALVRVVTPLGQGESVDHAQARAVEFAQLIVPGLNRYIPD